jgi:outer membrane protein assembly factor BamD
MKANSFLAIILISTLFSCSDYQKLLKSDDAELKYTKAVEYFDKGDFMRASTLFDEVSTYYKGTDRAESVLNYLAKSYMGQKDYYSASEYYKTYIKTYPKGKYTVESKYMIGYCYYLDSPDPRLDQTATINALAAFQEFIDIYPESERVPEANKLMDELNNKLAKKAYLGNYMGNNYLSAVITAQNALKKFPSTSYREDLIMLILNSKYEEAIQSIEEKKIERYRNAIDEYYNYINEFPTGKYRKEADRIFNDSKKNVKE